MADHSLSLLAAGLLRRLYAYVWLPWAVLAACLSLTYLLSANAQKNAEEELRANFNMLVREAGNRIEERLRDYSQVLRGVESLYASSLHVEREEFQNYTTTLRFLQSYPSIQGIGYAMRVNAAEKNRHILRLRAEGPRFSAYNIRPAAQRKTYAPVIHLQPFTGVNAKALGYDLFSSPQQQAAMRRAWTTGDISLSGKAPGDDRLYVYQPIFANGLARDTLAARRTNLDGWVFVSFSLNQMMQNILSDRLHELDVQIHDGTQASPAALMYDSAPGPPTAAHFKSVQLLDLNSHSWTMVASSLPAFEARLNQTQVNTVTYVGIIVSLLFALLIALLIGRIRALHTIEEMHRELTENEERWKYALEGSGDGVWDWDAQSKEILFSKNWAKMLGFEEGEIGVGMDDWVARVHPDDLPRVFADVQAHVDGETPAYINEHRCLCKDGTWKWILDRGMVVSRSPDGKPLRMVGTHTDISERKKAEESMQLASLVYQNSSEGMTVTDVDGTILNINPAFSEITGYSLDDVRGKNHEFLNSGRQDETFYRAMWQAIQTTGRWQGEVWNKRKNGEEYVEWLSINTIYNDDGSPHRRVSLFSDITKKKETEELVWKQANFDALTELPNRRMFLDRLEQEIRKSHRARQRMALMLLDLDHFKEINDTLGHDIGDSLLQEAAKRLVSCVRETDTIARLGGDEFTVILGSLQDGSKVERVYQTILQRLAEPFQLGNEVAYISVSIGITLYPEDATTLDELMKNADQAMYEAKSQGRNRYSYFTPAMQLAAQNRMRMVNDLHGALVDNQFRVLYQPIVELATGNIYKAEALIRWQHPTRGLVNPSEFIPIAEDTGLIMDIGDWIFKQAANQVKRWRDLHDKGFQISVNKSPVQFVNEGKSHDSWILYLEKLGVAGNGIVVEITERLLLDARSIITDKLAEFHEAGMQVSLDDFGTGYSSLSYLKKFRIDYLKIDRSFISSLSVNSVDMALCEAIIHMSHKLGMKVIAEGVETQEQLNLLAAAGCDYAQGYL
ncbi:MAG TPA: EAL domain-containing protein, partial [Methylophilaceae bacterium]|nr:EAL domain-containing protein [Methylophilaceae bacterium]